MCCNVQSTQRGPKFGRRKRALLIVTTVTTVTAVTTVTTTVWLDLREGQGSVGYHRHLLAASAAAA